MLNPTCPATMLYPQLHDLYTDKPAKRSLKLESSEYEVVQKRARAPCSLDMWVRLLQWVGIMLSTRRSEMDAITRVWNDIFAGHLDSALEYDNLFRYLDEHQHIDRRAFAEEILYDSMFAGPGLRRERNIGSQICQLPAHRRREVHNISQTVELITEHGNHTTLKDRHIDPWGESKYFSSMTYTANS
jgi:chitinase